MIILFFVIAKVKIVLNFGLFDFPLVVFDQVIA